MLKKLLTLSLLSLFLIQPALCAQNKYKPPSADRDLWKNQFTLLLADDVDAKKTRNIIEKTLARDFQNISIGAFKRYQPASASTVLSTLESTKQKKSSTEVESAREKLGRYLVVNYPPGIDIEAVFAELKADPAVLYVSISEYIDAGISVTPSSVIQTTDSTIITENKFWGYNKMRAGLAANYIHGHANIGVMDLGIDMQHPEFIDYTGNTWKGGNYHPNLSFSISSNATAVTNPTQGNPYSATGGLGQADAYYMAQFPDDDDCDFDNNGTSEGIWVGHGSHVAGIIGANATNNIGVKGVCRSCPLSIAQYNFPIDLSGLSTICTSQTWTHHDGTISETSTVDGKTDESVFASMGFLIDIGVQVINYSGGSESSLYTPGFCNSNSNSAMCLTLEYAEDRDVVIVAAAGNLQLSRLQFPAHDARVIGVSGLENISGGQFWAGEVGSNFGSNFGINASNGPAFSAPAKNVYSTFYRGKKYITGVCDEDTDGNNLDGYGYCTGTSMATPFISGVAGLVRSVNPLLSKYNVFNIMKESIGGFYWYYNNKLGYGTPRADYAVKRALGTSNGSQVLNRLTPLFSMYGNVAGDIAQTTKPQVAMAYHLNTLLGYVPHTTEALVNGFSFSESPNNPTPASPRADIFLLTTHRTPATGRSTTPLYRQNWYGPYGGNPNDADWVLVLSSELSGSSSFRAVGYKMDGLAGYIYTLCSPEPTCIPPGAVAIYRAYNSARDDHAVFTAAKVSYMQSIGYSVDLKKLGYAYPNQDSDSDGVIDGMEYILGTNPNLADSDCDGLPDGVEYPLTVKPASDPMDGTCGGGGLEQTPWGSNSGTASGTNRAWNYTLGYHFTPSVNGTVTSLGGYFNGNKTMRLYNKTTGATLATTTVNSNNSWSYSSITPVAVTAGQTYTVAVVVGGSGGSFKYIGLPKVYGDITIHASTYANGAGRPTNSITSIMYGQADITFMPD